MAVIPTYTRQENLKALPSARVQAAGDADAYGAGIARAGNTFIGVALQKAQEFEHAKALSALNAFQKEIDDYHLDPDKGVYNTRKLGNANGMSYDAEASMKEIAGKYVGDLSSPYMRQVFTEQAQKIVYAQSRANQKWETAQIQQYKTQEAESSLANGYNKISQYYDDPEQIEAIRAAMIPSLEYMLQGMGEEKRTEELAKFESNIATIQASRMIENSPLEAEAWVEENKDRFTPDMYAKVKKKAETEAKPYKLELQRDEIVRQFGDNERAAMEFVYKNFEGKEEQDLLARVEAYYADRRRLKEQAERDAYKAAQNAIANAKSYGEAIAIAQRWGGEARLRDDLLSRARGKFGVRLGGNTSGNANAGKMDDRNWWKIDYAARKWAEENPDATTEERAAFAEKFFVDCLGMGLSDAQVRGIINTWIYNKNNKNGKGNAGGGSTKSEYSYSARSDISSALKNSPYAKDPAAISAIYEQFSDMLEAEAEKRGAPVPEWERPGMFQNFIDEKVKVGIRSGGWLGFAPDVEVTIPQWQANQIDEANAELEQYGVQYQYDRDVDALVLKDMDTGKGVVIPDVPNVIQIYGDNRQLNQDQTWEEPKIYERPANRISGPNS